MLVTQHLKNQKGMAALEVIPIMIIIVLLLSFSFGFFGVIHTGILNSMAARNYAFETFNHRSDLRYMRSNVLNANLKEDYYYDRGFRVHSIVSDRRPAGNQNAMATSREITFGWDIGKPEQIVNPSLHNSGILSIRDDGTRYTATTGVNPVWIQTSYGICLTSKCTN